VSPVKYELGFYIPEDGTLHSHCCENLKSYIITVLFFPANMLYALRTAEGFRCVCLWNVLGFERIP
jgi:hypothetical protein